MKHYFRDSLRNVFTGAGVLAILCVTVITAICLHKNDKKSAVEVVKTTPQEIVGLISAAETDAEEGASRGLPEKKILKAATVERVLAPARELVTLSNSYSGGGQTTDYKTVFGHKVPCTTDQTVYTYEGCIKVGFDIEDIDVKVDNDDKRIVITVPEPKIISDELYEDEFKFWDIKNSVFNSSSLGEYSELAAGIKAAEEAEMFEEENIDEEVRKNAAAVFTMLLGCCDDTRAYEVVVK